MKNGAGAPGHQPPRRSMLQRLPCVFNQQIEGEWITRLRLDPGVGAVKFTGAVVFGVNEKCADAD
jgi:hypothetical protein